MEKIQSAIAKARAARGQQETGRSETSARAENSESKARSQTSHRPDNSFLAPVSGPTADEVDAAWAALPQVQFSPKRLQRNRIVALSSSTEGVAFDVLRTRFLQQMQLHGWRRVAVTSPSASCGKSTVAANLAFSLARQSELRVVLAELDLRRPSIAKMLGIAERHSFGSVLKDAASFGDNAVRYGDNLAISTTHAPMRDTAELLQSRRTATALDAIDARYEPSVAIFDMPPMLAGDDMMAFAPRVDCVLLVAAAESTTIEEVDACERDLAQQTNVLGVVLNKCRYIDKSYGYYG